MQATAINMNEAVGRDTMNTREAAAWNALRSLSCGESAANLRNALRTAEGSGNEFQARCFRVLLAAAIEDES